jgi:alpha-L-fucosidase
MEYMHLVGAEDVQRAASAMGRAAHEMQQAASSMGHEVFLLTRALENNQAFLNDWLDRFAEVLRRAQPDAIKNDRGGGGATDDREA